MSTNMFRLCLVTVGFIVAYGMALMTGIPVEKIMLTVAFLFSMDSVAKDLVMRILLAQNKELVDRVMSKLEEEKDVNKTE